MFFVTEQGSCRLPRAYEMSNGGSGIVSLKKTAQDVDQDDTPTGIPFTFITCHGI